ncbi:hypothetical protein N7472_003216 [Penicillium cf. griseofulvum]|uniref:Uncharacterized protein n=1 Tax=Penicillium cf. griseofulvum TaxID=2972120 RepID=A0A9W9MSW7_9EURO|nr:hypothetical protein N7472_003216 [Penicillium cf. griseofulvum]KAJ5448260.1 hypothetical protein N7445_003081 [Penicillium cf. griseofulvum]
MGILRATGQIGSSGRGRDDSGAVDIFVLGMALIVIYSVIVVVVVVMFVISTEVSFIGSYWQTVAQVVSKETQPFLEVADRMDDEAVRRWAKREKVELLSSRLTLG